MDQPNEDRRQFSRIAFDATVSLRQDDALYQAQLVDISLNGVLLAAPSDYELRTDRPAILSARLAEDVEIVMQVVLVHSSQKLLGFHCTSIDMDSMTHLRRLVEINLADTAAPERVLNEMLRRHKAP